MGGVHCDEAGRRPVTAMITIGVDPQELHLTRVTGDVDATFARTYREDDLLAFSDGTVLRARWQSTLLRPAAPAPRYRSGPDKPAPGRVIPPRRGVQWPVRVAPQPLQLTPRLGGFPSTRRSGESARL